MLEHGSEAAATGMDAVGVEIEGEPASPRSGRSWVMTRCTPRGDTHSANSDAKASRLVVNVSVSDSCWRSQLSADSGERPRLSRTSVAIAGLSRSSISVKAAATSDWHTRNSLANTRYSISARREASVEAVELAVVTQGGGLP